MLHAAQHIDGRVLWANLHLLFWLSLGPFTTGWVGEYPTAAIPTAVYGGVFLMAGVAWLLVQDALVKRNGPGSRLARAVGRALKGKLSTGGHGAAGARAGAPAGGRAPRTLAL